MRLWPNGSAPRRAWLPRLRHQREARGERRHHRPHPPAPGRPEDAASAGGAADDALAHRAGRGQRTGGDRVAARRGVHHAREPAHQDGAADSEAADRQDVVGLRLQLPAEPGPQPGTGARRARVRGAPSVHPSARAARHGQEPSGDRPRRGGGARRQERLHGHARGDGGLDAARRARGAAQRTRPLPGSSQRLDRRRDRLPTGGLRRGQSVLPTRQRLLRALRDDHDEQPRLRRMGRHLRRLGGGDRAARPAAAPRGGDPDRGELVPPTRAREPPAGASAQPRCAAKR